VTRRHTTGIDQRFNGPALLLRVHGRETDAQQLQIGRLPRGWQVSTSMPPVPQQPGRYAAQDYDDLVDHPFAMGASFWRGRFRAGGVDFEFIVSGAWPTFDGDQWVRAELVVHGSGNITHYVNGQKVLEYSQPQFGGGVVDPQAIRAYAARKGVDVVAVFGGAPIRSQQAQLKLGGHIVVGTVGRVLDLISRHSLVLHECRFLVLDEADEMLDLGFLEDVERILSLTPGGRQTALFSATMPPEIRRLADQTAIATLDIEHMVREMTAAVSAGVMGTMKLLLKLRDVKKSLPNLSARLGDMIRTNSEALLGSIARQSDINYSEGVSISSIATGLVNSRRTAAFM